jgi:putative endonuclease
MHYVYILESLNSPGRFYVGRTDNLRQRMSQHLADVASHAAKFRPWKLKTYFAFDSAPTAIKVRAVPKNRLREGLRQAPLSLIALAALGLGGDGLRVCQPTFVNQNAN